MARAALRGGHNRREDACSPEDAKAVGVVVGSMAAMAEAHRGRWRRWKWRRCIRRR